MMNYWQKVARGKYPCEAILYDGHFWQDIGGKERGRKGGKEGGREEAVREGRIERREGRRDERKENV